MTKILAISNIHGRLKELTNLLHKISQEHNLSTFDNIVFLGDYIAFGEESIGVLDMLIKLKNKYPQTVILKGNWEFALYHTLSRGSEYNDEMFKLFISYQQGELLKEFRNKKKKMYDYINFIDSMPKYFIKDNYLFTHAGIDYNFWDKKYEPNDFMKVYDETHLLWHLDFFEQASNNWFSKTYGDGQVYQEFPYKIVAGQVSLDRIKGQTRGTKNLEPFNLDNVYGIDFGAAFSEGQLGAVIFKDDGISTYVVDVGTELNIEKEKSNQEESPISEPTKKEKSIIDIEEESTGVFDNEQFVDPYEEYEQEEVPLYEKESPEPVEPDMYEVPPIDAEMYEEPPLNTDLYEEPPMDSILYEEPPVEQFETYQNDYFQEPNEKYDANNLDDIFNQMNNQEEPKQQKQEEPHIITLQMINDGMNIQDVAALRSCTRSSVENHIIKCLEEGKDINVDCLISAQNFNVILSTIKTNNFESYDEIKLALPPHISYFEINVVSHLVKKLNL